MNELKIAERIATHRKEKGITQEALAAYFNTATDELLGYEAEMSR